MNLHSLQLTAFESPIHEPGIVNQNFCSRTWNKKAQYQEREKRHVCSQAIIMAKGDYTGNCYCFSVRISSAVVNYLRILVRLDSGLLVIFATRADHIALWTRSTALWNITWNAIKSLQISFVVNDLRRHSIRILLLWVGIWPYM